MATAPEQLTQAEAAMRRELQRIQQEPPSADELRVAKAYLLGNFTLERRTNARQALDLATSEATGVGYAFFDRYVAGVRAVTPADVKRVARKYLATLSESVTEPATR